MPVSIPGEAVAAVLLAVVGVVVVILFEVVVFIRATRRVRWSVGGVVVIALGLILGLAQSGLEWIEMTEAALDVVTVISVSVLLLTLAIARLNSTNKMAVALLGAGLLYQFAWLGGRFLLPNLPMIGEAMWEARCERGNYCPPRFESTLFETYGGPYLEGAARLSGGAPQPIALS